MDWPTLVPPPLQFIAHFAHCSIHNLTEFSRRLTFCSWHKCPVVHPPSLPHLTVLTLQRSLLGPHWAMHEPSGPLSVLHRVKHAQNPLLFLLLLVVPESRKLGGGCLFVCLCNPLSGILVAAVLTPIWGRENGPLFTHLSVGPAPFAKSCKPLCN